MGEIRGLFISIVIAAYNEEGRISKSLGKIINFMGKMGYNYEVIVVDDGSTDGTKGIVNSWCSKYAELKLIENERNMGKGHAIRRGMLGAKGKYVVFSDADLSTPIEELVRLVGALEDGNDIAIGSRMLPKSQVSRPLYRGLASRLFNLVVRAVAVRGVKDTQCGFKCFKAEVVYNLFSKLTIRRSAFDVEVLYLAQKYGYRIKEVPVKWLYSSGSRTKLIKDALVMLKDLLKIKLNDWCGKYE